MKSVFPYGKASVSADGLLSVCAVVPQCQYPPPNCFTFAFCCRPPPPPPLKLTYFHREGRFAERRRDRQTERFPSARRCTPQMATTTAGADWIRPKSRSRELLPGSPRRFRVP